MLRVSIALALAASCIASANVPLRLRGGAPLSWSKLIKLPDTIKEGYSTESKLEITKQSDINDGTTLKSTFTRTAADKISHVLKAISSYQGVDVEASIDGSGKIGAEARYKDIIPGGEISVSADLAGGQKIKDISTPVISGDYRNKDVAATVSVQGSSLDAAAVVELGEVQVGLSANYDADKGKLSEPSLAARYNGGKYTLSAVSSGIKGDDVLASYAQSLNDKLDVAGTFSTKGNKFSLGAAYKVDGDSSVRGKVNSDGVLNLGYSRQVTKGASVNAGFEVDTNDVDKRKFGLSLKLQ